MAVFIYLFLLHYIYLFFWHEQILTDWFIDWLKPPIKISHGWSLQKSCYLIGQTWLCKNFSFSSSIFLRRDKSVKWLGGSFMLTSMVKFGPHFILKIPATLDFSADFHWDVSGNWINIWFIPHQMVQNSWGLDMTHLRIWKKLAKLLQYIRCDNPENLSLISCMD